MPQVFHHTPMSRHAIERCQQRGVRPATVLALLEYGDRHIPVGSGSVAVSVSRKAAARLRQQGHPPADVDRLGGLAVVVASDGVVVTVLHAIDQRYCRTWH